MDVSFACADVESLAIPLSTHETTTPHEHSWKYGKFLCKHRSNHPRRLHSRQSRIQPAKWKCKFAVVDTEAMEDGGIQVVDVNGVADDVVTELVGFTVRDAAFHSATRHPDGKASWMMIAAEVGLGEFALAVDGASEFACPDDEGVVKQASLFQIGDESVAGLIGVEALTLDPIGQVGVLVPATMEELDASNISLGHTSREEAVVGEGTRNFDVRSV